MVGAVAPLDGLVKRSLADHLGAAPTMGILFSQQALQKKTLVDLAESLPYQMELVGGAMSVVAGTDPSGALTQTNLQRTQQRSLDVGLTLGRFPEATVKSFCIPGGRDWEAQLEAQGMLQEGWKVFLVIARHRATADIVERLQSAHPKAAIIGGMATGETLYRIRQREVQELDEGVVGLMFAGDVPLAAFVSRGARGLGDAPFTFGPDDLEDDGPPTDPGRVQILTHVTDAEGSRRTALEAVMEGVHKSGGGGGGICIGLAEGSAADGYELTGIDNEMVVHHKAALALPARRGDDPRWSQGNVRFFGFDPDSCKEDLISRLAGIKQRAAERGERILGSVMFTCGARTQRFFGTPAFDATTFANTLPGVPMIGMYAGGEIGPPLTAEAPASKAFQVGGCEMHGFTAIFGIFIVPPQKPRKSLLMFADNAAIAAAYAELRRNAPPLPPPPAPPGDATGAAARAAYHMLPGSLAELRALPVKALKEAMGRLGLAAVAGSEKEDLVQEVAQKLGMEE